MGELPVTQGLAPHHGCSQLCAPVPRGEPTGRWEKGGERFPSMLRALQAGGHPALKLLCLLSLPRPPGC